MSRNICVYLDFLTTVHKAQIKAAADAVGFHVRFFTSREAEDARAFLQESEILYTFHPDMLRSAPATLQWFCCASAGVDFYCKDPTIFANPNCLLTNSNVYGATISEHTIMVALMLLRRMPEYEEIIVNRGWSNQLPIRSIRGSEFTILGTGNIGTNVAQRLHGMNASRIIGLSRSGKPQKDFDEVFPITALDQILPHTHFLIMALPETTETIQILNRERIAMLPPTAYIINVGRGSAIAQEALIEALNSGRLAGAALDVMTPEPLPAGHPLWETKNLIITPHISGNTTLDYTCDLNVEMFCENLANYAAGRPLNNVVDRKLGY